MPDIIKPKELTTLEATEVRSIPVTPLHNNNRVIGNLLLTLDTHETLAHLAKSGEELRLNCTLLEVGERLVISSVSVGVKL